MSVCTISPQGVRSWSIGVVPKDGCAALVRGEEDEEGRKMAGFPGFSHVAVTVSDLSRSREFYGRLFGSDPVLDEDAGNFYHVVYALEGGTLFGLHTHPTPNDQPAFIEFRSGLDHVAFGVASRTELEGWVGRLDALGIDHGEIVDAPYGSGLSFRDPDNIALELFAPPA